MVSFLVLAILIDQAIAFIKLLPKPISTWDTFYNEVQVQHHNF
jgi:hypothetical protein